MPHPSRKGWSRILYSTKIKLFPWIPEFIISFLTGKALTESTGWVKKYSEEEMEKINRSKKSSTPAFEVPSWFNMKGGKTTMDNFATSVGEKMKEAERDFDTQRKRMFGSIRSLKPKSFMKGA